MSMWGPRTLVHVDEQYDADRASKGDSRYGAYIMDRDTEFLDPYGSLRPEYFAAAAWRVATTPVMVPPFVRYRPDLLSVTVVPSEDDDGLHEYLSVEVTVPLEHGALRSRPPGQWSDWVLGRALPQDDDYPVLVSPPENLPSLTLQGHVVYPGRDWELPKMTFTTKEGLAADARRTVMYVAERINAEVGPMVERLMTGPGGA